MKKLFLLTINPLIATNGNKIKALKIFFLAFILSCFGPSVFAQVTVTPATGGTVICNQTALAGGSAPACTTLGTIKIAEAATTDFALGADQIVLSPPAGWNFCIGAPPTLVPAASAGDITGAATIGGFSAGSLTINFNVTGTFRLDSITITGLQVQPATTTAAPGYIFALSTTGVNGIITGAGPGTTDFGDLRLAAATSALYTVTGGGSVCPPGGVGVAVGLSGSDPGINYQLFNGATLVATLPGTGGPLNFGLQTATGTYTVRATNGALCGYTATMTGSAVITAAGTIQPITGVHNLCAYIDSELVHDATTGGVWNSSLVTVDTVGVSPGAEIQAFAAGIATITYSVGTCRTVAQLTVNPNPGIIQGPDSVCVNGTITETDTPPGGTWTSSNTGVATIGAFSGIVTGVTPGTTLIQYTLPTGCTSSFKVITVNPLPTISASALTVCEGATISTTATPGGGVWTSANTAVATIINTGGTASVSNIIITGGAVSGVAQSTPIVYTLPTGCATITSVTVDPVPNPITGGSTVCVGGNDPLTGTPAGGTWMSSNTSIATVDGSGVVYGVSPSSATIAQAVTITYTLPAGNCSATFVVTVEPLPAPILGPDSLCVGSAVTLTDANTGGTWSSSNSAIAPVFPSGTLEGNDPGGTSIITYTLPTGCTTSITVTVNTNPGPIISFVTTLCNHDSLFVFDDTVGGVWSISDPSIATIMPTPDGDSATVVAINPGTTVIVYTRSTGCDSRLTITVNPIPTVPVPNRATICQGDTTLLTATPGGGIWSTNNSAIATIDSLTGIATGVGTGTVSVSYAGAGGCTSFFNPLTVNALAPIHGDSLICAGTAFDLIDGILGSPSTWSSSNTVVALVSSDPTGGTATFIGDPAGGVSTITYTNSSGCQAFYIVTIEPISPIIPANAAICMQDSLPYFDATPGGVWSSSNTLIASIGAGSGEAHGLTAGVVTITYLIPGTGCNAEATLTVNQIPAPITGPDSVCVGQTINLFESIPGGVWGDSDPLTVSTTFSGSPDTVLGIKAGTAFVTYTFPATGCFAQVEITVDPVSPVYSPDSVVCVLDSIQLFDSTTGTGVWTSSNNGVATVSSTGVVTGVSAGTASISYHLLIGGCDAAPFIITVNPLPAPITGIDSVCVRNITYLFDTSAGGTGTWTSGNTSLATVDTAGIVTGVAAGVDVITYTLPNTGCLITTLVTVDPLPTGIYGTDSAMCNGDSILLRDTTAGGVWTSSNTSVATVNDTGYVKGLNPGTAIISYTLHVGACPATKTVTVYPIPIITIASLPNPPVICKGGRDSLFASGADTGGHYAWTPSYALSNVNIFNPIATPTITTTYEVIGTTAHGCRDSAFITVVVDSMLNHLKITGIDSLCAGLCDTLIASGNPEATFSWHPATGLSSAIGDTIVACPSATTTYVAVAIDAMGCKDSATFKLTINPIPQIKVDPNPVFVCRGTPKQVTASVTNADSNTTKYAWSPNLFISCDTCSQPYFSDTFNLVYRVIATTIYGCYDSLNVKVSVLDTNVNTISHDTDICIGDSLRLHVTSNSLTSNLDVPTYFWQPATGLSDPHDPNPEATPVVTTTYSVTVKENVCFTDTLTVTVSVQPLPAIIISPTSPDIIVAGTPTVLIATAPNVNAVRFLWVPGNSLNCDTCFNPIATPTSNTTYTVTVTSFYGCVSTDTVTLDLLCDGSEVFIPNTFTPNGDGVNDRFFVSGKGISLITSFKVFNRWGEMLYETHNVPANAPGYGWDGTYKGYVLEPDVFIYVVDALCELGTPYHYQGDVSIVK